MSLCSCVFNLAFVLQYLLAVQIGRDSRLSGPLLLASMVAGLASQGVSVAQFGLATTPAMFMSCIIPGRVNINTGNTILSIQVWHVIC